MQTRRVFLRGIGAGGAVLSSGCRSLSRSGTVKARSRGANGRLNVGLIGVGGRGAANLNSVCETEEAVAALCDVDESVLLAGREKVAARYPGVRLYKDFRVMLDAEAGLDAVIISTPDHGHGVQASWAMAKGCHVYLETPLARTLCEARHLAEQARTSGVVFQLGDHGSATDEFRRAVDVLGSGLLGEITEAHVWTSRPVWPQGIRRPEGSDPVPAALDWDLWLGASPARPFKSKVYHRFGWRAWHDFGTGALGDAGCQAMSLAFRVLKLGAPAEVESAVPPETQAETYPKSSQVRFAFAARDKGLPPVTMQWYEGGCQPAAELMPQAVAAYGQVPSSGGLLVGQKGVWVTADDTGMRHALALRGEAQVVDFEKHEACLAVPKSRQGVKGHLQEFFSAIRREGRTFSDMAFAAPLSECVLAGCVAQRVPGRLEWVSRKGRFAKDDAANVLVTPAFRDGWQLVK